MKYEDFNEFLHAARSICLTKMDYPAKKVLHIGAAGKWYFEWFERCYPYNPECQTGVDLNEKPWDLPENIEWITHDGSDLSFIESESFDLVFAGQFIEHIYFDQQASFLNDVKRILKPDGVFLLDSPDFRISNKFGWKQPEHISELGYDQAEDVLKIAGFDILDSYGIIPASLLSRLSVATGKYVKAPDFNLCNMDINQAVSTEVDDCFIWWIACKKNTNAVDYKALKDRLGTFYDLNQSKLTATFYSMVGKLVECDEGSYVSAGDDGQGFMLYGPYKQYEKGSYSVKFEFKSTYSKIIDKTKDIVCFVDVVTNQGNTILAKQEILYSVISENPSVKLPFNLKKEEVLEFRVFTYAKVPLMVIVNPEVVRC